MLNRMFRCLFVSTSLLLFVSINLYAQAPGSISANARVLLIDKFDEFSEGFAVVTNNNQTALINASGDIVVPFKKYYFKKPFKNKNIVLQQSRGSDYAYMNAQLKVFTPFHFAWDADFDTDGIAYNRVVNTMGNDFDFNINQTGIMIPLKHRLSPNSTYMSFTHRYMHALIDYNEGMVAFEIGPNGQSRAGFLNRKGVVIPPKYLAVGAFREGLAPVAKISQSGAYVWGFIDKTGKLAIPFRYSNKPGGFSSGLCYVQALPGSDFDFGYIDKTGALVFKMKYEDLKLKGYPTEESSTAEYSEADYNDYKDLYRETNSPFQGSTLLMSNNDCLFMISKSGEVKNFYDFLGKSGLKPKNKTTRPLASAVIRNEQLVFKLDKKWGIIDTDGRIILPAVFDFLSHFDTKSGLAKATLRNGSQVTDGYVNKNGIFTIIKGEKSGM